MENKKQFIDPSFGAALLVFLGIVAILIVGILVLKVDLHILLILGIVLAGSVASLQGYKMDDLIDAMKVGVDRALGAMLIFILIGAVIGSWIQSGTVPAMIYYGIKVLSPAIFLPTGLIICSITSMSTGTSWGATGTVGLAMMGMGVSMGIPAPVVAGMVVSGAFFGDKMSPISDTTNLSAASAGTELYAHIGAMSYTTIPSYIISLVLYGFIGLKYSSAANFDHGQLILIQETLLDNFNMNPVVILPMLVVLVLSILKVNALLAMVSGVFSGTAIAVLFQGSSLSEALTAINYGYSKATGLEIVDKLILRGGIQWMMWTFSLAFIALCLGGLLDECGFLKVLVSKVASKAKSVGSLTALVIFTCLAGNALMGEIYLSIILNGSLYRKEFEKRGLQNRMLSRLLEEGGTLTGPLIPWTTAGAFVSGVLGVSTMAYLPFAFLNLINPILSIIFSYMGIAIQWSKEGKNDGNDPEVLLYAQE